MSSTLKILVPLGLLLAVVFAVTLFSQYTPKADDDKKDDAKADEVATAQPLRFFTNTRRWDPFSESLADRAFAGFYEAGAEEHPAWFWFENRNPAPVTMQLKGVSCTACSGGRVAAIPPDVARMILQSAAVSALPQGFLSALPLGLAAPAALLDKARPTLAWQAHEFSENPAAITYTVPAAANADGWSPQWGVLELHFKVKKNPLVPLKAGFITQVEGSAQVGKDDFAIYYEEAGKFDVDRAAITVGELNDTSPPQAHDLIVYSATNAKLPELKIVVMMPVGASGEAGGFVSTGPPVPLPPADRDRFAADLARGAGRPVRVAAAVRVPVTVKARDGDAKIDIGELERVIWLTEGTEMKQVAVKGTVRGPVFLSEGAGIDLGTFTARKDAVETVNVSTERAGVKLAVVPGETRPPYLRVALAPQPDSGEQGRYKLTVTVPKDRAESGEIKDGVVVLEVPGPNPQRIRIPVKGRGNLR